jgi:two-component system alkaline phosphatase synthesis response regulator PhoP
MKKQRILVVDDDRAVVRLMRGYLEQAGYQVLVAYDGQSAIQQIQSGQPDLVLLDLMLPDRDGWDITRSIRNDPALAALPIIMLTARVTAEDKIIGLELGADDYVTKPYNPREVVARVRARLRAQSRDQQESAQPRRGRHLHAGALEMDVGRRPVTVAGSQVELTATEFDILRVLMEHPGYVWTRGELIRTALGSDFEGIDRTVDSHMRNLRRKIEDDPRNPTYVQTVYGVGYRLGPVEEDKV